MNFVIKKISMEKLTFEQIPQAVTDLQVAVAELKQILINTPEKSNNKPLNIKEAAAFINMSVPTLYGLVSNQKIPFHKGSKKLYFFEKELIEWLTGKEKHPEKTFKVRSE
jgi:excisionase family DNA binding protein